jgi:hypothetical protein
MDFLGHVLSWEGVEAWPRKIESIKEWQNLVSTKGVKSFLRLINFYKKFIKYFFALEKSFIDLLKKEGSFEWKDEQQSAFNLLKGKLLSTLVLRFCETFWNAHGCNWLCDRCGLDVGTTNHLWKQKAGGGPIEMANSWKKVVCNNELLKGMVALPRFS